MRPARSVLAIFFFCALDARAQQIFTLDSTVAAGGLDHERIGFDVSAGTVELEIEHRDHSSEDILDWGLEDPNGFRGWGGGNEENVILNAGAASRSYLPGEIIPGRWNIVIGKAKITGASVSYRLRVTLRETITLPAQPERREYVPVAALASGRRWYAGDLHVHSRESGDASPTLDELALFAREQGLDFIELSDHNTTAQVDFINDAQSRHPNLLFIPGVELTTYRGHINGIGATYFVDHKIGQPGVTIESAARALHDQGALLSINHPRFDLGELCIGCAWEHELAFSEIDAVEIATAAAGTVFSEPTLEFWDNILDSGKHAAPIGGSDDHSAGERIGPFGAPVGVPATYVFAEELSAAGIVKAIGEARTVVKLRGVSDPMVELSSEGAAVGDTVRANSATLTAKITGGNGLVARWVLNGRAGAGQEISGDSFDLTRTVTAPASGQDRYRVEVLRDDIPTTITSHIWLERRGDEDDGCGCRCTRGGIFEISPIFISAGALYFLRRRPNVKSRRP